MVGNFFLRHKIGVQWGVLNAALFCVFFVVPSVQAQEPIVRPAREPVDVASGTEGIVVSDSDLASEIGRDLLAKGGNAVDAAVGTAFALAVTWPEAGNIGGGGFMMIAPPSDDVVCINYRETAPASVDEYSFANWKNRHHVRMAGVPGTVRGLALAHQKYGRLTWEEIIRPSIRLAREGFTVDAYLAYSLNSVLQTEPIRRDQRHAEFRRVYGHPEGRRWNVGDRIVQPNLADTLEKIATDGPDSFYEGAIAQSIVAEMQRADGLISAEDLKNYEAVIRPAVAGRVGPYTIFGAPPPSSGGITVLMQLRMLEKLGLQPSTDAYWTADQVRLITEAMRRGFRERAAWLGDPDFVTIPEALRNREHAERLAQSIRLNQATPSEQIAGDIRISEGPYESPETTHFSVIDSSGMAVSNTYTLEGNFGCRVVVPGTGILLNNEMGDFNWYPGYTNRQGAIGTLANQLAPGKRMLSSMSPTIVRQDGRVRLVIGSPGGRTIINTVTVILVQTLLLDRPLEAAIDGPRLHHQWFPDVLRLEGYDGGLFAGMLNDLRERGHRIEYAPTTRQGCANGIEVNLATGKATGVGDWRRGAAARAVEPALTP